MDAYVASNQATHSGPTLRAHGSPHSDWMKGRMHVLGTKGHQTRSKDERSDKVNLNFSICVAETVSIHSQSHCPLKNKNPTFRSASPVNVSLRCSARENAFCNHSTASSALASIFESLSRPSLIRSGLPTPSTFDTSSSRCERMGEMSG